jgi:hypothetical protein
MVIANARFYGGRFVARPRPDDSPVLHVCLFERTGWWYVAAYALRCCSASHRMPGYRILPPSTHRDPAVSRRRGDPTDGDFIGRTPAHVTVMPRAARLVFPPALA